MKRHMVYDEAFPLVQANQAILLTGEKGSGKTTLARHIAEGLETKFFSISLTRQTTLSHIMGFMSVNGKYVESQMYKAATEGGLMLLDEIDAGDPNVLLSLNTIENGYISFPHGVVDIHPDFRLVATSNPQNMHQHYVGRSKLDASTLDRFDIIEVPTDANLERSIVSYDIYRRIQLIRSMLRDNNSSKHISMRDAQRYQTRRDLGLDEGYEAKLFGEHEHLIEKFHEKLNDMPKVENQSECKTYSDLLKLLAFENNPSSQPAPQPEGN